MEAKLTFKPSFIYNKDVRIIFFKKEWYFHLFIAAAAYFDVNQF